MGHDQDLIYLVSEWKWYVKFIFYPDFIFFSFLNQTVHLFTQILVFFQLSRANSSSSYPDLDFVQLFRCFSLASSHLYLFLFYFCFHFLFRWMKWVEDGSWPRFDLFGFRMKVICEVHLIFTQLSVIFILCFHLIPFFFKQILVLLYDSLFSLCFCDRWKFSFIWMAYKLLDRWNVWRIQQR